MPATITITEVSPDRPDVLALINALDDYYRQVYQPEHIHVLDITSLLQPDIYFLAAELDGNAIACGGFQRYPGYAELKRMYVSPRYRGLHLASRLLATLEARIRQEGYTLIRLETGDMQPEAVRMYEAKGYYPIPPFVEYVDDPHALFYEKRLAEG